LRCITDLTLRFWNVRLTCRRCGHQRIMSGPALWWLFYRRHWSDDLASATKRFYCSYCRRTDRTKIAPRIDKTQEPPTGDPLEGPTDYEWKKLIARYRS